MAETLKKYCRRTDDSFILRRVFYHYSISDKDGLCIIIFLGEALLSYLGVTEETLSWREEGKYLFFIF